MNHNEKLFAAYPGLRYVLTSAEEEEMDPQRNESSSQGEEVLKTDDNVLLDPQTRLADALLARDARKERKTVSAQGKGEQCTLNEKNIEDERGNVSSVGEGVVAGEPSSSAEQQQCGGALEPQNSVSPPPLTSPELSLQPRPRDTLGEPGAFHIQGNRSRSPRQEELEGEDEEPPSADRTVLNEHTSLVAALVVDENKILEEARAKLLAEAVVATAVVTDNSTTNKTSPLRNRYTLLGVSLIMTLIAVVAFKGSSWKEEWEESQLEKRLKELTWERDYYQARDYSKPETAFPYSEDEVAKQAKQWRSQEFYKAWNDLTVGPEILENPFYNEFKTEIDLCREKPETLSDK